MAQDEDGIPTLLRTGWAAPLDVEKALAFGKAIRLMTVLKSTTTETDRTGCGFVLGPIHCITAPAGGNPRSI